MVCNLRKYRGFNILLFDMSIFVRKNLTLTLSGRMVPNGHILKLFYQKLFQTSVEYLVELDD